MPTSPTGRSAREGGFTLLEVLAALAVVVVIAMLASPRLQNAVPGLALRTTAEALQADLRRARASALREMRETTLTIDLAERWWRDDATGRRGALPPDGELVLVTARQERLVDHLGRIRFYGDGGSTGGRVALARDGTVIELSVDWLDGRARLAERTER
jgi:general secretion pathway protein H